MGDPVWIEHVVFPLVLMGMTTLAGVAVYRLAARWIDRKHDRQVLEMQRASDPDVTGLGARVDALEGVVGRIQELEERLDFAERLLTSQRAHDRLSR